MLLLSNLSKRAHITSIKKNLIITLCFRMWKGSLEALKIKKSWIIIFRRAEHLKKSAKKVNNQEASDKIVKAKNPIKFSIKRE
jgi:hypothetical protein